MFVGYGAIMSSSTITNWKNFRKELEDNIEVLMWKVERDGDEGLEYMLDMIETMVETNFFSDEQ